MGIPLKDLHALGLMKCHLGVALGLEEQIKLIFNRILIALLERLLDLGEKNLHCILINRYPGSKQNFIQP